MVKRPMVFLKETCVLSLVMGGNIISAPLSHATPLNLENSENTAILYLLGLFCLLALGLIFWMTWDRKRLKENLSDIEQKNGLHSLFFASSQGVALFWDQKGILTSHGGSSLEALAKWFDLETQGPDLTCLMQTDKALSPAQYDDVIASLENLLTRGQPFRHCVFLGGPKKNIIIEGSPLLEGTTFKGARVFFRDATIEENISAFKEKTNHGLTGQLDFYHNISKLIHFPMWVRNKDLKLVWVNKAYVDAVDGETAEQVISQGLELVTSFIGKSAQDIAATVRDSGNISTEKHFVVIQGERRAVETHHIPMQMDGDDWTIVGYAQDITDLEKARGELLHHTESHSETLNKLSTAVAIFTAGKRLEYYNSAFSRLWHLPEGLLFSHPHHGEVLEAMREARRLPEQANFPEWKAEQLGAYTRLLEPVEEMWHLPDNTSLRVVTQPHPLGGLLVFYEDVTDHFTLERSYNTLFAVQKETLNNLHEGVAVFGIDGCLQLYNDVFAELWTLKQDFLDANPHTMDVMDACAKNYGSTAEMNNLKSLIVGGEAKKELSSGQIKRRDGSVLNYSAVPLPDGAMLITFVDVSDSFAIEKVLRERNLALEETDKIKTEFLAHMSYELRTPLNSIIGFSELLENEYQGPLNDVQHDYMQNILSASGNLLALINDILDLSVIEAGGLTLDIEKFDLSALLDQVVAQLQERISAKNIELDVTCQNNLELVEGDAKRIQHTLYNLLGNAVKFTPSLGHVTLKVKQSQQNCIITIQDSGIGVKPDEVEKIFEKFFTGSNVPNGQGAGLGLSLAKNFIELHGGRVEVDSSLNVGTKVTVKLPVMTPIMPQKIQTKLTNA